MDSTVSEIILLGYFWCIAWDSPSKC